MFFFLCGMVAVYLAVIAPANALEPLGYPGSTWGQLSYDNDSLVGAGALGYINQGIDWTTLPGDIPVNTFAEFRYRFRTENNDFYNEYGGAVGVELRKWFLKFGIDYFWQRFPDLPESSDKLQIYLSWYYDWDLKPKGKSVSLFGVPVLGFPGSTWGQISYDFDELVGAGIIGYFNQGIDWTILPGDITLNTFAEFRYRFRSENKPYYNAFGEAVGVEFKKAFLKFGIDYYWERFPDLPEDSNKLQFYLSWFYDWDFKPKGKTH
ncbi:MAG TPA: hypothetical protein VFG95_09740 [Nitrospiria bacterium]|nr:hypothetical protein [Nitrospiria bacterium]